MHAETADRVLSKRKLFLAKWKLRCQPVAASLDEAGERLFTFVRYPPEQWRSLRTTNAIERLREEFKRRIKTRCLLPCAETAASCFGRCWPRLRSPCVGSTAGRPSTGLPPTMALQPDQPNHALAVPAPPNFHQPRDTTANPAFLR